MNPAGSPNPYVRMLCERPALRVVVTTTRQARAEKARAARAALELGHTLLSAYRRPWLYLQLGERLQAVRIGRPRPDGPPRRGSDPATGPEEILGRRTRRPG